MDHCSKVRVEHCVFAVTTSALQPTNSYIGIYLNSGMDISLIANTLDNVLIGIMTHDYQNDLRITTTPRRNHRSVSGQDSGSLGQYGIRIDTDHTSACRIENNRIHHFWVGISLRRQAEGSLIAGNHISRSTGTTQDTFPGDVAQLRQYLDNRLYAIDVEAARCELRGNYIDLRTAAWVVYA